MNFKTVEWISCEGLKCADCAVEGNVILCLNSAIVAEGDCPFVKTTIPAELVNQECQRQWTYTFNYDADLLIPDRLLTSSDIKGVICNNCLTTYIQEYAGNEISVILDEEGTQIIVSQHGCEYPITPAEDSQTVGFINNADARCGNVQTYLGGNGSSVTPLIVRVSDDMGNEICAGSDGGLFVGSTCSVYTQTGHGLVLPVNGVLPVRWNGTGYVAAQANLLANTGDLLVIEIPDANTLVFASNGHFLRKTAHGLTVGTWYLLSTSSAGALTSAVGGGDISQRVLFVVSPNCYQLNLGEPVVP